MNKYCQGPKCHTYQTVDRKRGPKGSKYFQTRTVRYGYGDDNFCTTICQNDWWRKHGTQAVDHFGRIHEAIRLTEESAWKKYFAYNHNDDNAYYFRNGLTLERIPITEQQWRDDTYTIERARQNSG